MQARNVDQVTTVRRALAAGIAAAAALTVAAGTLAVGAHGTDSASLTAPLAAAPLADRKHEAAKAADPRDAQTDQWSGELVATGETPALGLRVSVPPSKAFKMSKQSSFYIGDSLTTDAWNFGGLKIRAQQAHWREIGIEAQAGAQASTMIPRIRAFRKQLPAVVLVALGTNDAVDGTPIAQYRDQMRTIVKLLHTRKQPRRITFVNIYAGGDPELLDETAAINSVLKKIVKDNKGFMNLVNWEKFIVTHPQDFHPLDFRKIHVVPAGSVARAEMYLKGVGKPAKPWNN